MIVYIEDQGDEYCVYLTPNWITGTYDSYHLIKLNKPLEELEYTHLSTPEYVYIPYEELENYL